MIVVGIPGLIKNAGHRKRSIEISWVPVLPGVAECRSHPASKYGFSGFGYGLPEFRGTPISRVRDRKDQIDLRSGGQTRPGSRARLIDGNLHVTGTSLQREDFAIWSVRVSGMETGDSPGTCLEPEASRRDPAEGREVEVGDDIAESVDLQHSAYKPGFGQLRRCGKVSEDRIVDELSQFGRC